MKKRLLALFMAFVMTIGSVPMSVFADGEEITVQQEEQEVLPVSETESEETAEEAEKAEEAEQAEPAQTEEEQSEELAGQVILMDEDGNWMDNRQFQTVEEALGFCNQEGLNADSLKLTLAQDWETEDFLYNAELDMDIDLGGFTWTVTGKDGLETDKAVKIANGTLTFTALEGFAISVIDGGLELTKVVFLDSVTEAEALICVTREESENLDWFVTEEVDFENCLCSGEDFILTQEPEAPAEEEEPAKLSENREEAEEEPQEQSAPVDGLLGAVNPADAWGKIYTTDSSGKETNVQYVYSNEEAESRLQVANGYSGSTALIANTLYLELMHDWDTNAYVTNTNLNIDVNLNGYKWTVRGGSLYTSKQVTIHDGTLSYKGSGSAAHVDGSQLTLKNLNVVDSICGSSATSADPALFIVDKTGSVGASSFIVENVTVTNMTDHPVFNIAASNIVPHPDDGLLANNYFKNVTIRNCSVKDNANDGAAVSVEGTNSNLYFEDCRFLNNYAADDGGAIHVWSDHVTLTFQDCVFDGNEAGDCGGAIYLWQEYCDIVLNNTIIQNGKARQGGAIYTTDDHDRFNGSNVNGQITSVIRNCYASDDGGAIYIGGHDVDVSNIRFINNISYDCGGAVYIEDRDGCDFSYCEFIKNATQKSSSHGGAVYMDSSSQTFKFCLFDHNSGARDPQDLYNNKAGNVSNCTFYSNAAKESLCSKNPFGANNNVYYNGERPADDWKGKGTAENPYLIESIGDLSALSAGSDSGKSYQGIYFLQTADIKGVTFDIGRSKAFSGNYDGGGHTVAVTITGVTNAGLFSQTNGGSVKNVVIEGVVYGDTNVGGLVGKAQNTAFQNCINNAAVNGESEVGGIAGYAINCTLDNCVNNGAITETQRSTSSTSYPYIGGLIGYAVNLINSDDKFMRLENCSNSGTVTAINANGYAGGLIGYGVQRLTVLNSANSGTVRGDTAGGIVGNVLTAGQSILIQDCQNSGRIYSRVSGGIMGNLSSSASNLNVATAQLKNCQNTGRIEGHAAGGILGVSMLHNDAMLIDGCTNQGNICSGNYNYLYGGGILGQGFGGTIMNCVNGSNAAFAANAPTNYVGGIVGMMGSLLSSSNIKCWLYNNLNLGNVSASGNNVGLLIGLVKGDAEVKNFASHSYRSTVQKFAGNMELGENENCFIAPTTGSMQEVTNQMIDMVSKLNKASRDNSGWLIWNYANGTLKLVAPNQITVTFHYEAGGSLTSYSMNVNMGSKLTVPGTISRNGYDIAWFTDEKMTKEFDLEKTAVDTDLHLYGQWRCRHDNLELVAGKAPTDTEFGLRDAWKCPACGAYYYISTDREGNENREYLGGQLGYELWTTMGHGKIGKLSNNFLHFFNNILLSESYNNYYPAPIVEETEYVGDETNSTRWYLVDRDIVLKKKLDVYGSVGIIVKDNCTLELLEGIELHENAVLRLYSQSVEPTTGQVIIHPNSSNGYAVYTAWDLSAQPTLEIVSANVTAKHSGKLPAVKSNVAVCFDVSKVLMIAQDETGDAKLILSIVADLIKCIDENLTKNDSFADLIIGDVEFRLVHTGDLSAFRAKLGDLMQKVSSLRSKLSVAANEAKRILPWTDQLAPAIAEINGLLNKLESVESSLLGEIAGFILGSSSSSIPSMDQLIALGWDVEDFPYAQVNNGYLNYIELLGHGDNAAPLDPRIMLDSQTMEPEALFIDTTNLKVLASEYVKLSWPDTSMFTARSRLALHMNNLRALMAMGEIQVWMKSSNGEVTQLPAEFDVENDTICVTALGQSALILVCDTSKAPEVCGHEALQFIQEIPSTCAVHGTAAHYLCTDCGSVFDEAKEPLEALVKLPLRTTHRLDNWYGTPATCKDDGVADCWRCLDCRKLFADEEGTQPIAKPDVIPALGHKTRAYVIKARPGKDGKTFDLCFNCNQELNVKVITAPAKVTAESRNLKGLLGKLLDALLPKIVVTDTNGKVIAPENYYTVIIGKTVWVIFHGDFYTGQIFGKL